MVKLTNLTWQQVALCAVLLVAVVVAYKLFGELPAGVMLVISSVVSFLLGRPAEATAETPTLPAPPRPAQPEADE